MISWMQKRRKYLVVTIWISTISFIAAGMIGWGQYSFSFSNNVAQVGDIDISINDFNSEYSALFNEYDAQSRQLLGQPLDREQAKMLNLESQAINRLINKALLENFALDLGLRVSDEEIAKEIQKIKDFHKDGTFDANLYKELLKNNGIKPIDYENRIKKALLVQKIATIIPESITPLELEVMNLQNIIEDDLEIQIIHSSSVTTQITQESLKNYYEKNKDDYKTSKKFDIEFVSVSIDEIPASDADLERYYNDNKSSYFKDGALEEFSSIKAQVAKDYKTREAQKKAFGIFSDFKNAKSATINENDTSDEILAALDNAKDGDLIKPIIASQDNFVSKNNHWVSEVADKDYFVVIKLTKKIPQEILPFEKVEQKVRENYAPIAQKENLENLAKAKVNLFSGTKIGYFNANDTKIIAGLNDLEKRQLLAHIFTNTGKNGYLMLGNKAVLYRINNQKIANNANFNTTETLKNVKIGILEQTLVEFLKTKYKIVNNSDKGLTWSK